MPSDPRPLLYRVTVLHARGRGQCHAMGWPATEVGTHWAKRTGGAGRRDVALGRVPGPALPAVMTPARPAARESRVGLESLEQGDGDEVFGHRQIRVL